MYALSTSNVKDVAKFCAVLLYVIYYIHICVCVNITTYTIYIYLCISLTFLV